MRSSGLKGVVVSCGHTSYRTVTTAINLKVGMKTVFANLGALLQGQRFVQIKEIGGVESQGKLCSIFDLGIGEPTNRVIIVCIDCLRAYHRKKNWLLSALTPCQLSGTLLD